MSSEWPIIPLGQLTINHDGKRRPVKESERKPGPFPYYGASGVVDHVDGFIFDGSYLLIGEDGENMRTRQTPIAFMATGKFWVNNHAHIVTGNDRADTRFLMYSLLNSDIHSYLTGAVMPKLTQGNLNKILLACPPLEVQKEIVGVLGTLDDRIALLRETNATLEAIAQALFKSWFVDFEPVRTKLAGRAPEGMDEATAALFPDGFEESELGLVPRGWITQKVEDIATKVGMGPFGSNIKVSTFVDDGIPVISGPHLHNTLLDDLSFKFITESHANKLKNSCVGPGDIVFTHAGTIGQVSLIPNGSRFEKYVLSQRQFFLRCDGEKMQPSWMTYFFRLPQGQHLLLANASQVGVPSLARPVSYLRSIKLVVPPIRLQVRFAEIAGAMHEHVVANRARIQTLATLRDTVLPRLISGQLRLPEYDARIKALAA